MEANLLVIAGNDPSAGAGIAADVLVARHFNVHACPVITCTTAQNTRDVLAVHPLPAHIVGQQIDVLMQDFHFDALKVGLIGSLEIAQVILELKRAHPKLPMILDPVLRAGGGSPLATAELTQFIASELLPLAELATPNSQEARRLSHEADLDQAAQCLLDLGVRNLLIKGAHEAGDTIINRFYTRDPSAQYSELGETSNSLVFQQQVPRLPGSYHGSGCTLASACASLMAKGVSTHTSVKTALTYTDQTLMQAYLPAQGQWIPRR
jgi:hydroxymethylpyrimidine/phosphomethylpyrimidine kinase